MFKKTSIYLKVFENYVIAENIDTGECVEKHSSNSFSHPRVLIGNFTEADLIIKSALSEVKSTGFLKVMYVLIQPMEKNEGGLTQIENRVLQELAIGAGATTVVVWEGVPLSNQDALKKLQSA